MTQEWNAQYEAMLKEMALCRRFADRKIQIECCFNLAQQYSGRIEQQLEEYHFPSPQHEIDFYKNIKPLFKSHIEYYNLVYHAEIFKPVVKRVEMKEFWLKEQQRLDKFILDNSAFYTYHKTGAKNRDEEYFLSSDQEQYYDDLIAQLLALERFNEYTQQELSKL